MSHVDIIRAWKDEEYRASLSAAELAELPAHPAGPIELDDTALDAVAGGMRKEDPLVTIVRDCPGA